MDSTAFSSSTQGAPHNNAPSLLKTALVYREAGRSVLPIAHGKTPSILDPRTGEIIEISWKIYQKRLATPDEIRGWFDVAHPMGFGIAAGPVSGAALDDGTQAALEFLDIEEAAILAAYRELVIARGYGDLLERLPEEQTPKLGGHMGYLCSKYARSTKLAQRKIGVDDHGHDIVKTLLETRGAGAQCVVAPTPPGIHPECPERGYVMVRGSWEQIPLITPEAREALWECARALNEYVAGDRHHGQTHGQRSADEHRVGDDFNDRVSREEMVALLARYGWPCVHSRGQIDYLRRPGKDQGWSATLGAIAPKVFYNFSSNGHPFDVGAYDPFGLYARLEHAGNFKAAARALVEAGYGRQGDHQQSQSRDGHTKQANDDKQRSEQHAHGSEDTGETKTLAEVVGVFRKWLHLPHAGVLYVELGAYAANRANGDPLWLLIIGGSGWGKTELLLSMIQLPHIYVASTLTEAALLSGTRSKERDKNAKGGLLRTIGEFGVLLVKDFTSILSMNRESSTAMLAALREIFDGSWTRHVGVDGGRTLTWHGKLALLAGCTGTIDRYHAVIGAMGERFLFYRLDRMDPQEQARRALQFVGQEQQMRRELASAVKQLFNGLSFPKVPPVFSTDDQQALIALATLATRCRTPVERDAYSHDIELILDAEAPARLALSLARLYGGMITIGVDEQAAKALLLKVGLDCMPALRRKIFALLVNDGEKFDTQEVADALGYPTQTARRALEDLAAHGIIIRHSGESKSHRWNISDMAYDLYQATIKRFPEGDLFDTEGEGP
jgi:Bifunctional DNA primase/polymerase, N-terminal/DeoR-like helix-turn-helix domain